MKRLLFSGRHLVLAALGITLVAVALGGLFYGRNLYELWKFEAGIRDEAQRAAARGAGTYRLAETCAQCHGRDGTGPSQYYPHLAGEPAAYLLSQLDAFAAGARRNPLMEPMADALSATERRRLSDYYAALPAPAHSPFPIAADRARGRALAMSCAACHGRDFAGGTMSLSGKGAVPVPRLRGQARDYLVRQLRAFRTGGRVDPTGSMNAAAKPLDDRQIQVLADYLAAGEQSQ
ncbi:MAG: cytochrome c4 [Pseudomonadota bacterium]|nr:cytochrome c4 [Pseudomonadota bacterium]